MTAPLPPTVAAESAVDLPTSRHAHLFLVLYRFYLPHKRAWVEEWEVIETAEFSEAVDMLLGMDGPQAVKEVDFLTGIARDRSEDAAHEVVRRIRAGDADLTRDRIEFCEEHLGVGILPYAA